MGHRRDPEGCDSSQQGCGAHTTLLPHPTSAGHPPGCPSASLRMRELGRTPSLSLPSGHTAPRSTAAGPPVPPQPPTPTPVQPSCLLLLPLPWRGPASQWDSRTLGASSRPLLMGAGWGQPAWKKWEQARGYRPAQRWLVLCNRELVEGSGPIFAPRGQAKDKEWGKTQR